MAIHLISPRRLLEGSQSLVIKLPFQPEEVQSSIDNGSQSLQFGTN